MKKSNSFGEAVAEVKRERLKRHLDNEVPELIEEWLRQLNAPDPFSTIKVNYGGFWGWESPYRPALEQNPDSNHMLRKHLRSRALWQYHTKWEGKLNNIFTLVKEIRGKTDKKIGNPPDRKYTVHYRGTALWQAFRLALGFHPDKWYRPASPSPGLNYGATKIEEMAVSGGQRAVIETEHWGLIYDLASLGEMKELVDQWQEAVELATKMHDLAIKALKESAIFHPCRFCKKLW